MNDVNWEAIKGFVELFSIKMVSSHHANDREELGRRAQAHVGISTSEESASYAASN